MSEQPVSRLQPARGTQDLLPETSRIFRGLDERAWNMAQRYGYQEIDTPIFEFREVFHRTLGETSDAVSKETYSFQDRGGEWLTLRPEGTAGIARALISNGLQQNLPLKLYYSGPMFRYERPQKGRYRQFHQIGVESLGQEAPFADVECIALGARMLADLGLADKVQLEINSLGDTSSRMKHRDLLVEYLSQFRAELSPDSQTRLEKNPLRILDSKDAGDRKILEGAPRLDKCLNDESKKFFDGVLEGLTAVGVKFQLTPSLVRGFDYYTHTVFEFTTTHLGAQSAVLAGGRYNGLVALMGGNETPGVGWAAGMERLALLTGPAMFPEGATDATVIVADDSAETYALKVTEELRAAGLNVELIAGGGNVGKKMKKAARFNATSTFILGGNERDAGTVTVKTMATGDQRTLSLAEFLKSGIAKR
ncbi:MAG: histidine--tRNA ligase [Bdellovibrionaceae bacterium]|nr:histidine--tRNA ligase [Pseudobdellovibrionaceae bacterium]